MKTVAIATGNLEFHIAIVKQDCLPYSNTVLNIVTLTHGMESMLCGVSATHVTLNESDASELIT